MSNKSNYTHLAKYYGVPVYYNEYELGDEWLKGTTWIGHLFVMWMAILDMLTNTEIVVTDAERL